MLFGASFLLAKCQNVIISAWAQILSKMVYIGRDTKCLKCSHKCLAACFVLFWFRHNHAKSSYNRQIVNPNCYAETLYA